MLGPSLITSAFWPTRAEPTSSVRSGLGQVVGLLAPWRLPCRGLLRLIRVLRILRLAVLSCTRVTSPCL